MTSKKRASYVGQIVVALFGIALLASTFIRMAQINDWLFQISMLLVVSVSWNLMASAGLISLGHAAFWGIGSYTAMIGAVRLGLPLSVGVFVAILMGAAVGCVLALATGRLRGIFFAIATLALAEGLRVTMLMLPDQTGGASGLYLPEPLHLSRPIIYLLGAICALICIGVAYWLANTPFNYACRAMRDNESAAKMLGLDPRRYRMAIMAISAGMVAGAGAINTWYGGYLDPEIAFNMHTTIEGQIATILGGIYSLVGPVFGSIAIVALSEATRLGLGAHEGASQLTFGVVLVLGVLFMPQGLNGIWKRLRRGHSIEAEAGDQPAEATL
jgi:branched-chain amino acid transport system permease protein